MTLLSVLCKTEREPRFIKLEKDSIVLTVFLNVLRKHHHVFQEQ